MQKSLDAGSYLNGASDVGGRRGLKHEIDLTPKEQCREPHPGQFVDDICFPHDDKGKTGYTGFHVLNNP